MRNVRDHIVKLVVVTVFVCAGSPSAAQVDRPDPHAEDRIALQQIKDEYTRAIQSGDLDQLGSKLAEGFSAVMVTGHETDSFAKLQDYWTYIRGLIGESGTYSLEVLPEPAKFSGDYALSQGKTMEAVVTGGTRYEFETLWSAVFVKQDGDWKLLRLHASMDPINNTFVSKARQQAILWSLIVGGISGALLCGVVVLVWRRLAKPSEPQASPAG